ncbi:hypothetical protein CK203_105271 [Vitis vinifera]|uniref:Uncharacterized protein n=1 Tax=Vitis vinifera TaxID=29760 RepID=A0A438FGN3_VITVI|nr:hypothetical protein CK203_105271 [Vitis vinifera]
MHPPRMSAPSCIVPPTEQLLVIRPHIITSLLPTFHGMESENPYAHIKEFEDVSNTFRDGGASIDLMRLKLFPFTLKDKNKWLEKAISNFSAKENENSMSVGKDTWKPLMLVLTMVLIHGYWGFMSKNPEEAMDFLSYVAEVSRGWDEPNKGEVGKMKSQPNAFHAKAGMYTLNEDVDMKAKFAAMTRRLEELELKKMHEVQAVAETPVQVNHVLFVNLMNTWWRSALQFQLLEKCLEIKQMSLDNSSPNTMLRMEILTTQVGGIIQIFHGSQEHLSTNSQLNHLNKLQIDNLQYSISRLTNLNTVQEKGRFPSQPHQNPKGIHEVETHEGESSQVRDVKALITLRSGKKVELPTPKPHVEERKKKRQRREEIKGKKKDISEGKRTMIQHFAWEKGENASEILEVLRQVKVNIPLLDMIKQVPTYAKFLKDLCTIKRGLNVNKKAFLTEQVVEKALLDLGASVNLLPYSVYKQLGLGELKPTSITLSLADRSVKIPRG